MVPASRGDTGRDRDHAAFTAQGFASSATWSRVTVVPGGSEPFPTEAKPSHYYAARRTDAATLPVGNQTEKFLFYRGVATVKLPLSATVSPDGIAHVSRDGAQPLGTLVDSIAATAGSGSKSEL